ncbi:MAG: hypothetical protein V1776_02015 [Candidatus Diapherotrites archaeon]
MKQRLISLSEEKDKLLMALVKERGGKKGSISSTVEEALELLACQNRRELAWKRLWELSDNAKSWGIGKFNRKDVYSGSRFKKLEKILADRDEK